MKLGIDIGGTNLCLGHVKDGVLQGRISVPSFPREASLEETLSYLSEKIERIFSPRTSGIGVGVPSVLDVEKGIVYDTANIPSWREVHLKDYLEEKFSVPVAINNDANCYALGAYATFPEDSKPEVLVGITLGTGVGMGIVENGRLFIGANCGAGELGCLNYKDSNIEGYCSKQFFADKKWNPHGAAQAALSGDPEAIALWEEFGRNMGALLCAVMYAYDPSHIVIGGGVANAYPLFSPTMGKYLRDNFPYRNALARLTMKAMTDDDLMVLGAAML